MENHSGAVPDEISADIVLDDSKDLKPNDKPFEDKGNEDMHLGHPEPIEAMSKISANVEFEKKSEIGNRLAEYKNRHNEKSYSFSTPILSKYSPNLAYFSKFHTTATPIVFILIGEIFSGKSSFIQYLINYVQGYDLLDCKTIQEMIDEGIIYFKQEGDAESFEYINESKNVYWKIIEAPGVEILRGGELDERKIATALDIIKKVKNKPNVIFVQKADFEQSCSSIKALQDRLSDEIKKKLFYVLTYFAGGELVFDVRKLKFKPIYCLKLDLQKINRSKPEKQRRMWERCMKVIGKFEKHLKNCEKDEILEEEQEEIGEDSKKSWLFEDNNAVFALLSQQSHKPIITTESKNYLFINPRLQICFQIEKGSENMKLAKEKLTMLMPSFDDNSECI
jgi:hypothetical protein